jgi:hypothetical protein
MEYQISVVNLSIFALLDKISTYTFTYSIASRAVGRSENPEVILAGCNLLHPLVEIGLRTDLSKSWGANPRDSTPHCLGMNYYVNFLGGISKGQ